MSQGDQCSTASGRRLTGRRGSAILKLAGEAMVAPPASLPMAGRAMICYCCTRGRARHIEAPLRGRKTPDRLPVIGNPRMSEYYGTDEQVGLQRRVIESIGWIAATPGACNSGRFLGCDELDRLGWDTLLEILRRDGAVGFRMLPGERAPAVASRLASLGFRLDTWDVFAGDRAAALPIAEAAAQGLPAPFRDMEIPAIPDDRLITGLQALMAENGIVPFPAALLTGRAAPAVLAAVEDGSGKPAAVAFGYLPHNAHSPWRRWAFVGLVAVDKAHRGQGLGRHVNARAVAAALRQLEAEAVYELVHASNLPSRRMVESSGLQLHPGLKAGIATVADAERFTR